jgi:flagellar protein FliT
MNMALNIPSLYTRMLEISVEMLGAANDESWNKMIVLEQERSGIVETLQSAPNLIPDTQDEREVLIGLIQEIQKCDEKFTPILLSWLGALRSNIESVMNEMKLGKQYGKKQASPFRTS